MNTLHIVILASFLLLASCSSIAKEQDFVANTGNAVSDANVKEFSMTAKNWEFDPSTITVNKGDKVIIHITSVDVDHGFILPEFSVNVKLKPGETVDAEFTASKSGEFEFHCNVFCGAGHRHMEGKLIVN